jgi:deoxycytidylate deaminase
MGKPAHIHAKIGRAMKDEDLLATAVTARETSDLVFGVTGYVGSGLSYVSSTLIEELRRFRFTPHKVKLSVLLAACQGNPPGDSTALEHVVALQDAGDALRKAHGPSIVAGLGIREIHQQRSSPAEPRAFVLDSIKHPAEVEILRAIYGRGFYLVGVLCNEDERASRLRRKFKDETDRPKIETLMRRDAGGREKHGQQVRKTLHLSDFFLANDAMDGKNNDEELGEALERFVHAVTGTKVVRPNRDEKGMHAAWAASLRSSCMSRQVGAAIMPAMARGDEVLATGTNDPPAPGGGLYTENSPDDNRCFKWPEAESRGYCRNDRTKQKIYAEIFETLTQVGALGPDVSAQQVQTALEATRVRDLIEFSRAIHAEMDAVLALARSGVGVPKGGTLYCNTFPCHSCARHIVAAGLGEVIYLEPYTKSLALELHADAVQETSVARSRAGDAGDPRVVFRLFSGVAPRRFAALFEKRRELKDGRGSLVLLSGDAAHADPVLKRSFLQLEQELARKVDVALEGGQADGNDEGPGPAPTGD